MALLKTIRDLGLAALLFAGNGASKAIESKAIEYDVDPRISAYMDSILVPTIKAQEDAIGIEHFGMPHIVLRASEKGDNNGQYDNILNSILIRIPHPYQNFDPNITSQVLHHELGHFYADKLSEYSGNGSWPGLTTDLNLVRSGGILTEGIAEYFERTFFHEDDSKDLPGYVPIDKLDKNLGFYSHVLGYWLVKPIIDIYGKEGIKYIITHTIEEEDFIYLQKYTERALKSLGENTKNDS